MGKVRTSLIKRTARKLVTMYPNLFTADFEHNKQAVAKLCIAYSKKLRNQIAGYITHIIKMVQNQSQGGNIE